MHYILMTLQPRSARDRAAQQALRQRQRTRFVEKKQRLCDAHTVRYASRKRYADSRPRVNGRFVRKADLAADERAPPAPPVARHPRHLPPQQDGCCSGIKTI